MPLLSYQMAWTSFRMESLQFYEDRPGVILSSIFVRIVMIEIDFYDCNNFYISQINWVNRHKSDLDNLKKTEMNE